MTDARNTAIALWLGTPIRQPHGSLTLKGEDAPFLACEVIDDSVDSLKRVELALNYLTESVRVLVLVKLERAGDVPRTSGSGAIKKSEGEEEEGAEYDAAEGEKAPGSTTAPVHRRPVYSRGLFWVYTSSFRGPERNFIFIYHEAGMVILPTLMFTYPLTNASRNFTPLLPLPISRYPGHPSTGPVPSTLFRLTLQTSRFLSRGRCCTRCLSSWCSQSYQVLASKLAEEEEKEDENSLGS